MIFNQNLLKVTKIANYGTKLPFMLGDVRRPKNLAKKMKNFFSSENRYLTYIIAEKGKKLNF